MQASETTNKKEHGNKPNIKLSDNLHCDPLLCARPPRSLLFDTHATRYRRVPPITSQVLTIPIIDWAERESDRQQHTAQHHDTPQTDVNPSQHPAILERQTSENPTEFSVIKKYRLRCITAPTIPRDNYTAGHNQG
eukprot:TRINITY_DN11039_c0_g1_i1.p1 TRINITY_DN11039_c0_g1~~TRINITY_DN11039_c0_g1_i1.p1  ORF type:complete len:136 (-),score=5.69 TRINITY_DN11039_c0_g1_i1:26-433(-)